MTANTECASNSKEALKASLKDEPAAYQLVGGVMAYQGNDAQPD